MFFICDVYRTLFEVDPLTSQATQEIRVEAFAKYGDGLATVRRAPISLILTADHDAASN